MSTRDAGDRAEYLFGTAAVELDRLRLQHKLWSASAFACWERADIGPGRTVLDLGCGPGFTTLDLAALVTVSGQVIAIDGSTRFIDYLQQQQATLKLPNIDARVMDAQALALEAGSIDIAFTRWLLCYVPDPDAVVRGVVDVLRPGGVFAIQDYVRAEDQWLAPPGPAHARVVQVLMEQWRHSGGDPAIGLRLPAVLGRHGLVVEVIRPIQRLLRPGSPAWEWPSAFFRQEVPNLVAQGHLSAHEQSAFEAEWAARSADETAYFWAPPMVEVIARKPLTAAER